MLTSKKISFNKKSNIDLYALLKEKVENYFTTNNLSTKGNFNLYLKSITLFFIYILLYYNILFSSLTLPGLLLCFGLLGISKGLIGFNLVHDALHGSFSNYKWLNSLIGYWFDFNGTSSYIWKISHNQHHHVYTNIPGHDDDIDKAILLRLNPVDKIYWFHRFQQFYAPILYSFIGINWVFYSDYAWLFSEKKKNPISNKEITLFIALKIANLIAFLILPLMLIASPWWHVLLGYFSMQVCAGIVISIVFQLAHVVENVHYFTPNEKGEISNNWITHELLTTSNFATHNLFLTSLIGGLNFQIEHHLFPQICHVHYPKISKIIKETVLEFGLPYNEHKSFYSAVCSHFRTLKKLGRNDECENIAEIKL